MSGLTDLKFLLGLASGFLLFSLLAAFKKQIERAFDSLLSKVPLTVGKFFRYRKWSKKYQKIIYEEHRHLRYVGIKHSVTLNRPKLEDVYVNLELQAASTNEKISRASPLNLNETLSLDLAVNRSRHLVVLGNPGAGKTTLFEYMVCVCCSTQESSDRGIAGLLPIYVPLRRCSSLSRTFLDQLTDPATRLLPPDLLKTYPSGFFESYLNKGKCLLLFDGLDEVLNEDEHVAAARMVETTAAIFPKCRLVVNSRLAGWRNLLGSQFTRFVIRDLSQREIAGLVNQWYLAVINEQVQGAATISKDSNRESSARRIAYGHAEKMLAVLKANPRLMQIAETPLILSLMCLVFYMRQDLPRKRAKLYEECIEILLEDWDRKEKQMKISGMPTLEQKVNLLERIAVRYLRIMLLSFPRKSWNAYLRQRLIS
jgi:predicted NACHT family NTPase